MRRTGNDGQGNCGEDVRIKQRSEGRNDTTLLALKMKKRAKAKECMWLLEVGKVRETGFPLDFPEGKPAYPHHDFNLGKKDFRLLIARTVR